VQDNTVCTFLTTVHKVFSGRRAALEDKHKTWVTATRKRREPGGASVKIAVKQPPAQWFYNYYYDGGCGCSVARAK
jgi:hypothetical protein